MFGYGIKTYLPCDMASSSHVALYLKETFLDLLYILGVSLLLLKYSWSQDRQERDPFPLPVVSDKKQPGLTSKLYEPIYYTLSFENPRWKCNVRTALFCCVPCLIRKENNGFFVVRWYFLNLYC